MAQKCTHAFILNRYIPSIFHGTLFVTEPIKSDGYTSSFDNFLNGAFSSFGPHLVPMLFIFIFIFLIFFIIFFLIIYSIKRMNEWIIFQYIYIYLYLLSQKKFLGGQGLSWVDLKCQFRISFIKGFSILIIILFALTRHLRNWLNRLARRMGKVLFLIILKVIFFVAIRIRILSTFRLCGGWQSLCSFILLFLLLFFFI